MMEQVVSKIREMLVNRGLENPFPLEKRVASDPGQRQASLEWHFSAILEQLGLNPNSPSLSETPRRLAKLYSGELLYGLDYQHFPRITRFPTPGPGPNEPLQIVGIRVHSLCEHHFLPIQGQARVEYLPKHWVLGLSKFHRVVEFFSRRPQMQERLTQQLLLAFQVLLDTEDVAVHIEAEHSCIRFRGPEHAHASFITQGRGGRFSDKTLARATP